jgi:hypothetical protein
MELSLFLAKLLGLYLLIIAGLWTLQKEQVDRSVIDFSSSRGLILFSGVLNIIIGLAIAIGHPIWEFNWRGLITFLGYLILFQGIMRFAFIDQVQRGARKIEEKGFWPAIGVLGILGAILTYFGFMM